MNPQTSNNPEKTPDFDFILKQPGTAAAQRPKNKKVIILIVLVVLMIIVVVGGTLFSSLNDVEQEANNSVSQGQVANYEEITKQFIGYLQSGDYAKAFALIEPDGELTVQQFEKNKPTWDAIALSKCTLKSNSENLDQEIQTITFRYNCPYGDQGLTAELGFVFIPTNQSQIKEYGILINAGTSADTPAQQQATQPTGQIPDGGL